MIHSTTMIHGSLNNTIWVVTFYEFHKKEFHSSKITVSFKPIAQKLYLKENILTKMRLSCTFTEYKFIAWTACLIDLILTNIHFEIRRGSGGSYKEMRSFKASHFLGMTSTTASVLVFFFLFLSNTRKLLDQMNFLWPV